ncbi:MAG: hypothetical protein F6J86_45480, partial [Symploca sp. SIO1B1]|nr:hypothetical protein [Symploca sp. SIO1B1]
GEPVDLAAQNGRRTIGLETQYRKRDFATPVVFMRVTDGYLFKRQGEEVEFRKANDQPTDKKNTQNIKIIDQHQEVNQQGKYNINAGAGSTVHQHYGVPVESQADKRLSKSNRKPVTQDSTQIIQNVKQQGEKNVTFEQASNFRIGDDYYESEESR